MSPIGRSAASLARGLRGAVAAPHGAARLLAVGDSRTVVRALFLSSGARSGWLERLDRGADATIHELASATGVTRTDRLEAWLAVGCELHELSRTGDRYRVRGRRARAIAAGDGMLTAHYASVLDYQSGPYGDLDRLLAEGPDEGRGDLGRYADEIAQVSLAATPFVAPLLHEIMGELRPARVLDAGCGSAVYSRLVLEADPAVRVTGVDLSEDVVIRARSELADAGYGDRIDLVCADIEAWSAETERAQTERAQTERAETGARFDLVMSHNNLYYFAPERRAGLLATLARQVAPGGELLLTTMTWPGSVAAAHLHLMLVSQAGHAALPRRDAMTGDFERAGLQITSWRQPVPTEPYVVVRAVPA